MSFIYEDTGTVSVTSGSASVVGTGTAWAANYSGIALNIDGLSYPVASIDSVNTLTLAKPYPGATSAGVEYQFMPLQPENYQLALSVKAVLDLAGTAGTGGTGTGTDGTNGSVILAGVATPIASLGNDGDYYLNEATYTLYGPKASGAWPATGLLLKGPQGDPGIAGVNGNTILSGSGAPSNAAGINGDFYLDVSAYRLYGPKASGSWPTSGTSLVGPAGSGGGSGGSGSGMVLIETITLSADAASIGFANIPQAFGSLKIIANAGSTDTNNAGSDNIGLQFNGNNAGYQYAMGGSYGAGTTFGAGSANDSYGYCGVLTNDLFSIPGFGTTEITIPCYMSARQKSYNFQSGCYQGNVGYLQTTGGGMWGGTGPITDISLTSKLGFSLKAGSTFSLYGIAV